ncbi:hypothetical protein [Clostridium guangxiense]|uniref:hypothetical protein n=1 Tax=Clostridium guangxiense TaxID=1662055 RepID=UPI001E2FC58E|nr:hypothetical protein [Clostridium guangxiense]MCD2345780.1 hypothetical protein [Clostridium guangxiense]
MKSLVIESENCLLTKSEYGTEIDGRDLGKIIAHNIEGLEDYKKQPVKLEVKITPLGNEGITILVDGNVKDQEESEENANE